MQRITGMDPDVMKKVWEVYASTGARDKAGSILYALGQTQHSYGSQNCRAMCMVQLLLGNVGIAGGGINALRGEPNVQGSTDVGVSSHQAPGYLSWPTGKSHPTLAAYLSKKRMPGLLLQQTQVLGVGTEGMVWRKRHQGKRLLLRSAAENESQARLR